MPSEYVGKDVAVVGLDNMLAAYYEGKQIAVHKISYLKKDMVVNPAHYQSLTVKQGGAYENTLLQDGTVIDLPIGVPDLSVYDEASGNE